jgi:hypothetical protein
MNKTRATVSTFGSFARLVGIQHGLGEALQDNRTAEGVAILFWPGSDAFCILAGEPAMTIVPKVLATFLWSSLLCLAMVIWVNISQLGVVSRVPPPGRA